MSDLRHGNSNLTKLDVVNILDSDKTGRELALKYDVSDSTISRIKNGATWKYLELELERDKLKSQLEKAEKKNAILMEGLNGMDCACRSYGGGWQECEKCEALEKIKQLEVGNE